MNMKKTYSGEYRTTESFLSTTDVIYHKIAVNLDRLPLCKSESKLEKFICAVMLSFFIIIINSRFRTYTTCMQIILIISKNLSIK